jgi:hypothetical protein
MNHAFSNDLEALVSALGQGDSSPPEEEEILPPFKDVLACQFSSWYPNYCSAPGRRNTTIPSIILDLPTDFIDYLQADGVHLPRGVEASCIYSTPKPDSDEESWSSSSSSTEPTAMFDFPELNRQIEAAIHQLGGAVVPKLNWSCPKDAVWMNGGTLKCETVGDVYLLLKSSDFIAFDLQQATTEVADPLSSSSPEVKYQLVLRKWSNLYPSQEFRVFVRQRQIRGISQRQATQYYPHVLERVDHYQRLIEQFWDDHKERAPCDDVVMDIYIDKNDRVWLIDFNVWGSRTDALLFSWSELIALDDIEMRVVETERQVKADPLSSYRAPIDVLRVGSAFDDFMGQCRKPSELEQEPNDEII